jgi:hypothetical protein
VDAVVDLGEGALEVPIELEAVVFLVLEALEFLDEVELELDRDPGGEFEGDVLVGVSAAVAPCLGDQADGTGALVPLFGSQREAVETGLHFNPVEFDGIKTGIVDLFPDSKKLDGIAIAEPIPDEVVGSVWIAESSDVSKADVVRLVLGDDVHHGPTDFDAGFGWLFHDATQV